MFRTSTGAVVGLGGGMKRRDFTQLIVGSAVWWPCAVHAQQPQAMPVIGYARNAPWTDAGRER